MKRSTSRNLYLCGLIILSIGLLPWPIAAGDFGPAADSAAQTVAGISGLVLLSVGSALILISYIGALIKLAKLSQWVWFTLLLLFSGITMLVYIFAGPPESTGTIA